MVCPTRRAIGGEIARLARAPERPEDRSAAADKSASCRDCPRLVENDRRIRIEVIPPREDRPRMVDWLIEGDEPRRAEFWLIRKLCRRPLRCDPDTRDDDRKYNENLTDEQFGRGHASLSPACRH